MTEILTRRHRRYQAMKRLCDITFVLAVSPLAILLMCGVAIYIRVLVGVPRLLYSQIRYGQHQKPFRIYKFRTLKQGDCVPSLFDNSKFPLKLPNQSYRIGRWAALIRASGLDELPQLYNVLKGDMSLIGPRPLVDTDWVIKENFGERFAVKPGLTGLWQTKVPIVCKGQDKLAFDCTYVKNFGPVQDLKIFVRSFYVIILRCLMQFRSTNWLTNPYSSDSYTIQVGRKLISKKLHR